MAEITDDLMKEMLTKSKTYSLVILKSGPVEITPENPVIIGDHGKTKFRVVRSRVLIN